MNNLYMVNDEILSYMKENNRMILNSFGDPMVLLHRIWSGSTIGPVPINTYDDVDHKEFTVWEGGTNPPNLNHPDIRTNINEGSGSVIVNRDGSNLIRVPDEDSLEHDNEYYIYKDASGSVKVAMYQSGSVVNITYNTICSCVEPERFQPVSDCPICYGTGFEGGYNIYHCSGSFYNPDNTILVRIPPIMVDNKFEDIRGKTETEEGDSWTLGTPEIGDLDVVVPVSGSLVGRRYELMNVYKSHLRNEVLSQRFSIRYVENTHVLYQFDEGFGL